VLYYSNIGGCSRQAPWRVTVAAHTKEDG